MKDKPVPPKSKADVGRLLFARGSDLAVIAGDGDGDRFWLCRALQHVYENKGGDFAVQWLEKGDGGGGDKRAAGYSRSRLPGRLERESVLCKVKLCRANKNSKMLVLPPFQKKKVDQTLKRVDQGRSRPWEDVTSDEDEDDEDEEEAEETQDEDEAVSESDEGYDEQNGDQDEDEPPKKVKRARGGAAVAVKVAKKTKKATKVAKAKKEKEGKKATKKKESKKKDAKVVIKGPKLKGKLKKPRPDLTQWEKDPLFESREAAPFISTSAESRLLFRAVALKDATLLKKCIADKKQIFSLDFKKSFGDQIMPIGLACRSGWTEGVRLLSSKDAKKARSGRAKPPECLLEAADTGVHNPLHLGIRHVRKLNVSRGNREGNNAFVKDQELIRDAQLNRERGNIDFKDLMTSKDPFGMYKFLEKNKMLDILCNDPQAEKIIAWGHVQFAAYLMEQDMKANQLGSDYSRYHLEALTYDGVKKSWDQTKLREVSMRKGAGWSGVTPLHFACVNPKIGPLKQLFAVCPDVNMSDRRQRKLVHYAAAAENTDALKFLVDNGANLEDVDKQGVTPLMRACAVGRVETVKYIIDTIKSKRGDDPDNIIMKKMGPGGVNVVDRMSRTAAHYAVETGSVEVMRVLHEAGANLEKPLSARLGKGTVLMRAAQRADLDMVKFLVDKVKLTAQDSQKRTVLTHAVMNGSAAVASYLLRLGFDADGVDSSGNSNLHYAVAYGWYFCAKILVEAGANVTPSNEWKLTPLAVAFLKGHVGLGKYLLSLPGVDVDFRNDAGKTTLLVLVSEANRTGGANKHSPLSPALLGEVKELVEIRKADAAALDYDGKNALHYLCSGQTKPRAEDQEEMSPQSDASAKALAKFKEQWETNREYRAKLVRYFLDRGAATMKADKDGYLPVMRVMEAHENVLRRKDYELIEILLEAMLKECNGSGEYKIEKGKVGLLNAWADNVSLYHIDKERKVYDQIKKVTDKLSRSASFKILPSLDALVEARTDSNDSYTAFLQLCGSYTTCGGNCKDTITQSPGLFEEININNGDKFVIDKEKWTSFQEILADFRQTYNPKLMYKASTEYDTREGKKRGNHMLSAVAILSDAPHEPESLRGKAFKDCFEAGKNDPELVDALDVYGRTALVRAVNAQNKVKTKILVEMGRANVNICYTQKWEHQMDKNEKQQLVYPRSCPLYDAVEKGSLEIVKTLLKNAAELIPHGLEYEGPNGDKVGKILILSAVQSCLIDRNNKDKQKILRVLAKAGANFNVVNSVNRSGLHLSVSATTDEADQALDLERALLLGNCSARALDDRRRLPLHYAFVKIGRHADSSHMDPIEVVSLLVEAMEEEGAGDAGVDVKDEFGSTPLHYAAYRGATVSCLLLLQKGANINAVDTKGNTPLAYAVMGEHDGCALVLLQKGASVNVNVYPKDMAHSRKEPIEYKYLSRHYDVSDDSKEYTLFQGIISNNWLGISHVALAQFESFGMTVARAVEVAFHMQKLQFAKNLLGKQVSGKKLRDKVTNGRDLLLSFAYECKADTHINLQADIVDLVTGDKPTLQRDNDGCTALHYACMNHNYTLLTELLKLDVFTSAIDDSGNSFNICPIGALFWNSPDKSGNFEHQNKCLKLLLDAGANPNKLFSVRKFDFLRNGYELKTKGRKSFERIESTGPAVTALIVAIVHLNYDAVKMLLSGKDDVDEERSEKRMIAGVNVKDGSRGLSPMMYAVKTNDAEVVAQLLAESGQRPVLSKDWWTRTSDVDLSDKDSDGYGVLHHVIEASRDPACTYDNSSLFNSLVKAGCDPKDPIRSPTTGVTKTTAALAEELGADQIGKVLKVSFKKRLEIPEVEDCVEDWGWDMYDIFEDAQKMLKILEDKAEEENKKTKSPKLNKTRSISAMQVDGSTDDEDSSVASDDDDEDEEEDEEEDEPVNEDDFGKVKNELYEKQNGCTATKDAEVFKDHTVLMQKIDVKYGAWGMYNYYRMQIWKEKHKNLWVLFTNWGRIGQHFGQYQNTPFGSEEQAVAEFQKIFKAKSGNEWSSDVADKFENKPGKYRLVHVEHLKKMRKRDLHFDLDSKIPSRLPESVQRMIKDVTNVSMYVKAYSDSGSDVGSMPFGRIKREVAESAQEILDKLEKLVKKKDRLDTSIMKLRNKARRNNEKDEGAVKAEEAKQQEVVEEIYELTSEFYFRLPKGNMEYTKLPVIDNEHLLDTERARVDFVLYLETAERLLLAAQYRKDEVNPLDYIYRALGCKMSPLDPGDQEAAMIMRYMYNSNQANDKVIDAIYKVSRPSEETNFASDLGNNATKNRKLLWHGTKGSNLLSILSGGLKVSPIHAPVTGKAFGNGTYSADAFEKSWAYTYDWRDRRNKETGKYMFLCDVALGRTPDKTDHHNNYPPKGCDSMVYEGQQTPDPTYTVRYNGGLDVPLGPIVNVPFDRKRGYRWGFNEYITYKDSQTALRYLVRIRVE